MVKRFAVGAHYGFKSWLLQRLTALLMVFYIVIFFIRLLICPEVSSYAGWQAFFQPYWFRWFSFIAISGILFHAWVGLRDIVMDYVKPDYLRLVLYFIFIVILFLYELWVAHVLLWR